MPDLAPVAFILLDAAGIAGMRNDPAIASDPGTNAGIQAVDAVPDPDAERSRQQWDIVAQLR